MTEKIEKGGRLCNKQIDRPDRTRGLTNHQPTINYDLHPNIIINPIIPLGPIINLLTISPMTNHMSTDLGRSLKPNNHNLPSPKLNRIKITMSI